MTPDPLLSADREREANTEAGGYIEDDIPAWQAFVEAFREYGSQFDRMTEHLGSASGAASVLAGSMLSWMADQRGVFVRSASPETTPAGVLDEAWAAAEKALPEGWQVTGLDRDGSRWIALAERIEDLPFGGHVPGNPGTSVPGPTPAAALLALAAALGRSGSGR